MKVTHDQPVAATPSPKYKAMVPDSIRTPRNVETKTLGTLKFFDGMPSADTVAKTYDYLDVARAAESFLAGVPAASLYSALEGFKSAGMQVGDLGIAEELLDARSLFLTPNTTTVYGAGDRRKGRPRRYRDSGRHARTGSGRLLSL